MKRWEVLVLVAFGSSVLGLSWLALERWARWTGRAWQRIEALRRSGEEGSRS